MDNGCPRDNNMGYHSLPHMRRPDDDDDDDQEQLDRSVRRKIEDAPKVGGESIQILVGPPGSEREETTAHKNLLVTHSEFFQTALNGRWQESGDRTVTLEHDQVEFFTIFHRFLCSGQIFSSKECDLNTTDTGIRRDKEWDRLVRAWILGEKLLSDFFKDAILDAIQSKMYATKRYLTKCQDIVYENSAADCGMRRLMVDIAVWHLSEEDLKDQMKKPPKEFAMEVAIKLFQGLNAGDDPMENVDSCDYHDHGDWPCYKDMF